MGIAAVHPSYELPGADLMIVARGTYEEDRAAAQCAACRTWPDLLSGRPGHDRPGTDLRFRKTSRLQICSYRGQPLDADGRAGRCIWRAIPRAIKAHVIEGSIWRPASRCPDDDKAACRPHATHAIRNERLTATAREACIIASIELRFRCSGTIFDFRLRRSCELHFR